MEKNISDETVRLDLIKNLLGGQPPLNGNIGVESMDDAALVTINNEDSLVIASDFIRGSGFYLFQLGYLNYFDVAYYLIAANLSDIAAMGAKPSGLTTVIRYSKEMTDEQFVEIFNGMKSAADKYNTPIIGGDIGGYSNDVFCATAFGFMKTKNALLRKNVKDNDILCVTGNVGLPITALTYFKEVKGKKDFTFTEDEEARILNSWKRPKPRIAEGLLLSENHLANACQDVSDGLKATIDQIAELSGKHFSIKESQLPIDDTTKKLASYMGIDPVQIAISASVDFELLFTVSPENIQKCEDLFKENSLSFTIIGNVNSKGNNFLIKNNGEEIELPGVAWKQQEGGNYLKEILSKKTVK